MKKIGILTYFWADNPGTFLQAYATQEAFRKRLPDARVELVNYKHRHVYFKPSWRHINLLQLYRDFRRYRIYERVQSAYLRPSSESLISRDYEQTLQFVNSLKYDMLVAGADTILQFLDFHHQNGTVPIYWLPPQLNGIKVMCGSSCRAMTIDGLSPAQRTFFKQCINQMPLIGVRDEATYDLMRALGLDDESKLTQIPDPTFSLEIDYSHADALIRRKHLDFSRPSVMIGLPSAFKPAPQLARYYKSQGYRVFCFGYAPYADVNLQDVSPFEWAGLYRYFDLVLTDRFHGTLFSIRNNTPVVSIVCQKNLMSATGKSKYASLWSLFGLEQTNWINGIECSDFDTVMKKIDKGIKAFKATSIQEKLGELRKGYLGFVDKVGNLLE